MFINLKLLSFLISFLLIIITAALLYHDIEDSKIIFLVKSITFLVSLKFIKFNIDKIVMFLLVFVFVNYNKYFFH